MRLTFNRAAAVLLMTAVMVTGSFAMTGEGTFAASKVPAKPKITKAAVVNSNAVQLKWSKAKNAAKYKVYRKKASGKFVLVKTTTKRSFQNRKLAYGTKYTYKVTAISRNGKKHTSKIKVVYTKPAKPVITAKIQNKNQVKLTWKKAKGAVKYKVYRKKASGKFVLVKTTTKRTYVSKSLAYGTKYTYKVTAISRNGKKNTSKVKTVTTGKKPAEPVIPSEPATPVTPETPDPPDDPAAPDTPSDSDVNTPQMPEESETPTDPGNQDASLEVPEGDTSGSTETEDVSEWEKEVTYQMPVYETGFWYYLKDAQSNMIFKTKDEAEFQRILQSDYIIIDGATYPRIEAAPTSGFGETNILVGYQTETTTLYQWENTIKRLYKDAVLGDKAPELFKMPVVTIPDTPSGSDVNTPQQPEDSTAGNESGGADSVQPETPAERTVTVKIPFYETDTVYWIKDSTGQNVIYKSTDWEEWGAILDGGEIIIDGVNYGFGGNYGSGAFDEDQDGYPDEKYMIIVGYEEDVFTESEYNYLLENSDIGKMPDIIVIWND